MRRLTAALLPAALVGAAALADDADLQARVEALERQQQEAAARLGAKLFARSCAACHGRLGRGDGPGAADLDPPPRDLTSTDYRFRTTASGEVPRTEDLARTIRRGLPGSSMPAFGDLFSEREMAELIGFVQSLHGKTAAAPVAIGQQPSATPESIATGRALYLLMGCGSCHGEDGSGRGPSARALTDSDGRPMRTTDFRHDPFKGGRNPDEVVRTLVTGLNGAPMPSYSDAILFAREDFGDLSMFEDRMADDELDGIVVYVGTSPTRAQLDALEANALGALRNRRLAALAHYVLSLDRRHALGSRLFRQQPEREPRP